MKKLLLKKFSTFIVTAMMFSISANAQIVYTDVNPDTSIDTNNGAYHLDLNSDGINDFNITYTTTFISQTCGGTPRTGTNIYILITPLGSNEVGNGTIYPSALLLNSHIDSSSFTWKNIADQILTKKEWICRGTRTGWYWGASYGGNWNGAVDKYIPLRLDVSSQKYYGWVRLNAASGAVSFTVKDYAYNSIPDSAILAGQTIATGINENYFASSIKLFPIPAENHLTIVLGGNNKKVDVTITDITGKIIHKTTARETQKMEVNTEDFKAGVYFVQIQTADFIETKNLIVKK